MVSLTLNLNNIFSLNSIISILMKSFLALSFFTPKKCEANEIRLVIAKFFFIFSFLHYFGVEENSFTNISAFNINEGVNYY